MSLSFRLERFGWADDQRLELIGRWSGLSEPSALRPTLVVHAASAVHRLEPVPESLAAGAGSAWSVAFPYGREAPEIERATLVMGDDLLVELPPPSTGARRFGRQLLRAYRTPRAVYAAEVTQGARATSHAAVPDETEPNGGSSAGQPDAATRSPLALHGLLVRAQEELEEARAEVARVEEVAEAARHDAEREHRRRLTDTDRLREALATARLLADEQLAAERETMAGIRSAPEDAQRDLTAERDEATRLEGELEALRREGAEAAEREAAQARAEAQSLREELAGVRAELEERTAAAASLSASLDQARHGEQLARARSEALQQRVDAARAAIGDVA